MLYLNDKIRFTDARAMFGDRLLFGWVQVMIIAESSTGLDIGHMP